MPHRLRFRRASGAEYVDEALFRTESADRAELFVESGVISKCRNGTGREAGAVKLEPGAIEMPAGDEWVFALWPAEQDNGRGRRCLGAIRQQRRREAELVQCREQRPKHK